MNSAIIYFVVARDYEKFALINVCILYGWCLVCRMQSGCHQLTKTASECTNLRQAELEFLCSSFSWIIMYEVYKINAQVGVCRFVSILSFGNYSQDFDWTWICFAVTGSIQILKGPSYKNW